MWQLISFKFQSIIFTIQHDLNRSDWIASWWDWWHHESKKRKKKLFQWLDFQLDKFFFPAIDNLALKQRLNLVDVWIMLHKIYVIQWLYANIQMTNVCFFFQAVLSERIKKNGATDVKIVIFPFNIFLIEHLILKLKDILFMFGFTSILFPTSIVKVKWDSYRENTYMYVRNIIFSKYKRANLLR